MGKVTLSLSGQVYAEETRALVQELETVLPFTGEMM
jgi:hypothetical protein